MIDGRDCEYNVPETKLFPPPAQHTTALSPVSLQVQEFHDPLEQRALHYFRERAVSDLTGFTTYTRAFWNSVIPGLSQSEPAIRHIAIALSAQHEAQHSKPDNLEEINRLCFKHHSLALHSLSHSLPAQKEEVLLVSCIAFITFERCRDLDGNGNYLDYAIAGLKILREREKLRPRQGNGGAFNLVDDFIEPMLFQIELIFSMFCEPERVMLSGTPMIDEQSPIIPAEFSDVGSACCALFRIMAWRYITIQRGEVWSRTSHGFLLVKSLFKTWLQSLARLQSTLQDNEVQQYHRIEALRHQAKVLNGAILYSVRDDIPAKTLCRPALVYLSLPDKLTIYTSIDRHRKVNLNGMNGTLYPWPHAKRVGGPNGDNFVAMELTASGTAA